jgi:hypothetical protein
MQPDVEPFAKDFADKQKAFWDAQERLAESSKKLFAADPSAMSYYTISEAHTRVFNAWSTALKEMNEAARIMHEKAFEAIGLPKDHPLWSLARKG